MGIIQIGLFALLVFAVTVVIIDRIVDVLNVLRCVHSRVRLFVWLYLNAITGRIRFAYKPFRTFMAGVRGRSSDILVLHNDTLYLIKLIMFFRKTCEVYARPDEWAYKVKRNGIIFRRRDIGKVGFSGSAKSWGKVKKKAIQFDLNTERQNLLDSRALKGVDDVRTILMFSPAPHGFYTSAKNTEFGKEAGNEAVQLSFGHKYLTETLYSPKRFAKMIKNNTANKENRRRIDREQWCEIKRVWR